MKLRPTAHESSWMRIIGGVALIVAAVFFVRPMLPASYHQAEPLADTQSLRILIGGGQLPEPPVESIAQFHGTDIQPPTSAQLASLYKSTSVLGDTSVAKRIEVDLTSQKVYAYEGARRVHEFTVSTGKWARTPTGEFRIWAKVRSQKMSGGDRTIGTYYYLPNVPYVMFFYNNVTAKMRGFSFHGTYWHDNFGHPMSHGCVNMKLADAQTLYEWATPVVTNDKAWSTLADASNRGTRVLIYGETPRE
ncbi:L,D-transpeptidase [Candidatus Gottesmanbacteria bacterium]|nr:L,D-transpeptidase [Candidatus Gottesmanbacteria bacterium]